MSRLEEELRKALRLEEPPQGFTERVLSRAASAPQRIGRWEAFITAFRLPWVRWAGALALGLLMVVGLQYHRERERRAEGEQVKAQLLLALRITADRLQFAQAKVLDIGAARQTELLHENGASPSSSELLN